MTTDEHIDRNQIITEWFCFDWIGDREHLPSSKDVFIFMKILIDVVSIFGKINPQQRKYIIGRGAILGMTDELLKELERYEPNLSDDINELFEGFNRIHIRKTRTGIIYNLFRIFGEENKLDEKILNTIQIIAGKLGVTKDQIEQLQDLYQQEERIRQQRATLLFPHGFQDVLMEYRKLY